MKPDNISDIPIAQTVDPSREQNPYASPQTMGRLVGKYDPDAPVGIWRFGNALLMHADAELPPRCILNNVKCDETERQFYMISSLRLIHVMAAFLMFVFAGVSVLFVITYGLRFLSVVIGMIAIIAMYVWRFFQNAPKGYPSGIPIRIRRDTEGYAGDAWE